MDRISDSGSDDQGSTPCGNTRPGRGRGKPAWREVNRPWRVMLSLIAIYAVLVALMALQKPLFVMFHCPEGVNPWRAAILAMWHGLDMDCSMAGYLAVIPGLLLIAGCWTRNRWPGRVLKTYYGIISALMAAVCVTDIVLYGYWGFRLDSTPLFYFTSSPSAAMASAGLWEIVIGVLAIVALAVIFYLALNLVSLVPCGEEERPWLSTVALVVMVAALFIPIRGGLTVSTMNPSRAYFSDDMFLNHAALNPGFNLLYSLSHGDNYGDQYQFFDAGKGKSIFEDFVSYNHVPAQEPKDLPDVYLVILESFSAHLMPSLGGEPVAMRLDTIAREGLLFTRFYGSSFRTDRALPAILGGLPGQPSTSVMKYPRKIEKLPSIAGELGRHGYKASYYYGGDANFTNMLAYLHAQGFNPVVSDRDFPLDQRLSKWGAPDEYVFNRAMADAKAKPSGPRFTVIQTSSSHEPFEPPATLRRFAGDKKKNAFAYTDSCLGYFVDSLRVSADWKKTLVVIVPDHLGGYPSPSAITEPASRHHLPLVMAGGWLKDRAPARIGTIGSQTDIAATLLGMLGISTPDFPFSKDLLSPGVKGHAFFSEKELVALVTEADTTVYELEKGRGRGKNVSVAKAYLQTLYDYLSKIGER